MNNIIILTKYYPATNQVRAQAIVPDNLGNLPLRTVWYKDKGADFLGAAKYFMTKKVDARLQDFTFKEAYGICTNSQYIVVSKE